MDEQDAGAYFTLFNEIGIIEQISRTFLEARLPDGLLVSHFGVVSHLIQVPKPTMTHTLAGLEKHGLVEMRPNPDDKRSKRVWLTPQGRAFRNDTIQRMVPLFQELAQDIPPEKIAALMPVLQEVRASIDALRDRRS